MVYVTWYKRDLRTHDHRPLVEAARRGAVLPLYVIEEEYWRLPDTSQRQRAFTSECLAELDTGLCRLGQRLTLRRGSVTAVLEQLHRQYGVAGLFSHEEIGNGWTYKRDRKVGAWSRRAAAICVSNPGKSKSGTGVDAGPGAALNDRSCLSSETTWPITGASPLI